MSPKRLSMAALVTVAILTTSAFAQSNELTGIIGRTFISNQGVKGTNLFDNYVHFGKGRSRSTTDATSGEKASRT